VAEVSARRLIVVSNRLPHVLERQNGRWEVKAGSGGLVSALAPILKARGGVWIGWSGLAANGPRSYLDEVFEKASLDEGYKVRPVSLTDQEIANYYHGYSNEVLWPLFHDFGDRCQFNPEYWHTYVKVNRKFAETLGENGREGDFIWIHDYQLLDVAHHLREAGNQSSLAFFLHIPFPSPDILMKLPERHAIMQSLLAYDLVGFQSPRDRRNFIQCVRTLIKGARVRADKHLHSIQVGDRTTRAGVFPIGIDAADFARRASSDEVEQRVREIRSHFGDRQIVLGIDRLDYTKGIPERLKAFADLLHRFPEVRKRIHLFQVVVPSREGISEYDDLKSEIERLVSDINGRYSDVDWVPIHYFYRSLTPDELLALYRTANIGLVTPLKDGMNLVAKEYCACSIEEDSVLILSQFAGAAAQLGKSALIVNPFDVEQCADALYNAFRMPAKERRMRMRRLRKNIQDQDVFWWVDSFMRAATDSDMSDFPVMEDYIPEHYEEHPVGSG
jgi:trehalose 6-phosphate synthase